MKFIRKFNESSLFKDRFTQEDVQWVRDSVVELQDEGYSFDISGYDQWGNILTGGDVHEIAIRIYRTRIMGREVIMSFKTLISLKELGEEFLGRLFGMMKDRHEGGKITLDNEYGGVYCFKVLNYDSLDFLFDEGNSDVIRYCKNFTIKLMVDGF